MKEKHGCSLTKVQLHDIFDDGVVVVVVMRKMILTMVMVVVWLW